MQVCAARAPGQGSGIAPSSAHLPSRIRGLVSCLPAAPHQRAARRGAGAAREALPRSGTASGDTSVPMLPLAPSPYPLFKLELSQCSSKCITLGFLGSPLRPQRRGKHGDICPVVIPARRQSENRCTAGCCKSAASDGRDEQLRVYVFC